MEAAPLFLIGFMFGILLWQVCIRVFVSIVSLVLHRDLYDVKLTYPMDGRQRTLLANFATAAVAWISGLAFWSYREYAASVDWAAVIAGIAAAPLLLAVLAVVAIRRRRNRTASNATT